MTTIVESAPGRIAVNGALTFATARDARTAGLELIAANHGRAGQGREIVVDCGSVGESDSAGLAVLLDWLGAAQRRQMVLRFSKVPERLTAIAQISEIEDTILPRASS